MDMVFISLLLSTYHFFPLSIFLVDHAWTFQPHRAREQLLNVPGLADRMANLMDIHGVPSLVEDSSESGDTSSEGEYSMI